MLELERESAILYPVEYSLWKRLWTCLKADYKMNEFLSE